MIVAIIVVIAIGLIIYAAIREGKASEQPGDFPVNPEPREPKDPTKATQVQKARKSKES